MQLIFNILYWGILFSSFMVVYEQRVLYSALFLIISFLLAAMLWIWLQAEFLGLALALIYVGSVIIFILFIDMTCSTDWRCHLPAWCGAWIAMSGALVPFLVVTKFPHAVSANHSITTAYIGKVLIQNHMLNFWMVGILLLFAVIIISYILSERS